MPPSDSDPTTAMRTVEPGLVLGDRYELGPILGSGGMAVVFLAHDRVLERDVAVKVLRDQYAGDPHLLARFTREAFNVARLAHPGLVTIFDAGVDDGTAFIVMELVHGRTVHEVLLATGPLPVGQAVAIAIDVCDVLDVAHRAGVVHRDIKPGNILLADDGRTRVFDFGIARSDGATALTQVQTVVGTAAYISPEQARGEPAAAQSDLYALGCTLVEMLTGAPPFSAETPVALLFQQIHAAPTPPSVQRAEVAPELDAAVLHLLAKDVNLRTGSAAQARRELLAVPTSLPNPTLVLPALPQTAGQMSMLGLAAAPTEERARPRISGALVVTGVFVAAILLGLVIGAVIRARGDTAAAAPASTSSVSAPSATPSPGTPVPQTPAAAATLVIPVATTVPAAFAALRSVVEQGRAAGLVDSGAAAGLLQLAADAERASEKGHGKSAPAKVRALDEGVRQYAASGQVTGDAVPSLGTAIAALRQLIG